MNKRTLKALAALAIAATSIFPALAQTPIATCSTAPTTITALTFERSLTSTSVSSTTTPAIPTSLQPGLTSGALELRQNISLNTSNNVITITEFAAQPTSSAPTPQGSIVFTNVVSSETFNLDKIYTSCQPTPSLLITGTLTQNFPVNPIGSVVGVPAAISVGYTTDNPAKINNVVLVYSGLAAVYTAGATGTLTFPTSSVVPPGTTTANAPVISVAGGLTQSTAQKEIFLDATGSTSPLKLQLTYTIAQIAPPGGSNIPQQAAVNSLANGTASITFLGGKGTYSFSITAQDSAGNKSNQIVTIQYYGN